MNPERSLLTFERIEAAVRFVPDFNLVYLKNPKAACSSISQSLWVASDRRRGRSTFSGNPHRKHISPFEYRVPVLARMADLLEDATFFSVVRHPFPRLASAYFNKLAGENVSSIDFFTERFVERFALDPDVFLSLEDALRLMASEYPDHLDPHLRPQADNILSGCLPADRIIHLETPGGIAAFLDAFDVAFEEAAPHKTGADARFGELMDDVTRPLALNIFARDFELFGYSHDAARMQPVRDARPTTERTCLALILQGCDAKRSADERKAAFSTLAENAPHLDCRHLILECRLMPLAQINALAEEVRFGSVTSWRLAAMVANSLLRHEKINAAHACLEAAQRLRASREPIWLRSGSDPHQTAPARGNAG